MSPGRTAWIPHAVLLLGLAVVLFPVYVAFVASSLPLRDILDAPMTLVPGPDLVANYHDALARGTAGTNGQPVATMMLNSLVMALAIAIGKIAISLPSAYAVAPAIAGVLWLFLFNPSVGIVAAALRRSGVDWNYLLYGWQALLLVILAAAWKQISYNFLFFLAGLQAIPKTLVEAAAIDGAGANRRFWRIVFPLLAPTSFFLLVVNIVYAFFDTFGIIHNVTQGGPARETQVLVYKVWYDGVVGLDLGGSAAQSVILMAIVIALTAIQFRFIERRVHYA